MFIDAAGMYTKGMQGYTQGKVDAAQIGMQFQQHQQQMSMRDEQVKMLQQQVQMLEDETIKRNTFDAMDAWGRTGDVNALNKLAKRPGMADLLGANNFDVFNKDNQSDMAELQKALPDFVVKKENGRLEFASPEHEALAKRRFAKAYNQEGAMLVDMVQMGAASGWLSHKEAQDREHLLKMMQLSGKSQTPAEIRTLQAKALAAAGLPLNTEGPLLEKAMQDYQRWDMTQRENTAKMKEYNAGDDVANTLRTAIDTATRQGVPLSELRKQPEVRSALLKQSAMNKQNMSEEEKKIVRSAEVLAVSVDGKDLSADTMKNVFGIADNTVANIASFFPGSTSEKEAKAKVFIADIMNKALKETAGSDVTKNELARLLPEWGSFNRQGVATIESLSNVYRDKAAELETIAFSVSPEYAELVLQPTIDKLNNAEVRLKELVTALSSTGERRPQRQAPYGGGGLYEQRLKTLSPGTSSAIEALNADNKMPR